MNANRIRAAFTRLFLGLAGTVMVFTVSTANLRAAVLTHRYSFTTDATDSVGGANGILSGNAFITNDAVYLDGTNSFVLLPNNLFTNYSAVSLEAWFMDASINSSNAQIYTFSGTNGGMTYQLSGLGNCVSNKVVQSVNLPAPAVGGTNHLVWTQDGTAQVATLYINGSLAAQSTNFTIYPYSIGSTTNDCIGGCGRTTTISNFHGGILEFRIYQGALAPLDVAVLDAFGPDQAQTDPGTLQDVRVVVPTPAGPGALFRAGVFADFTGITNVNISTQPGLVLTSDNTNVIAIAPDERLQTIALGTANITAVWQGFSNTLAVTVGIPQDIALVHRYGFNEQTNDWIVHDSVGGANGRIWGPAAYVAFTGTGEMKLVGFPYLSAAYAALPPYLISCLSEVSIEAWVTWTPGNVPLTYSDGAWQRIFDFGSQLSGIGQSYLFLTPATDNVSFTTKSLLHTAITTNLNIFETPRLNWTNILTTNVQSFVALTYSPSRKIMKMYLNGIPIASGTASLPLSGIVDTNCWLGRSMFAADPYFNGYFNEFRIYRGLLSDADVAADYVAGPDVVGADYVLHFYPATNSMTVTWGPSATNMILQTCAALGGNTWMPAPTTAMLQNGRYSVNFPMTNTAAFYRLHTP